MMMNRRTNVFVLDSAVALGRLSAAKTPMMLVMQDPTQDLCSLKICKAVTMACSLEAKQMIVRKRVATCPGLSHTMSMMRMKFELKSLMVKRQRRLRGKSQRSVKSQRLRVIRSLTELGDVVANESLRKIATMRIASIGLYLLWYMDFVRVANVNRMFMSLDL
jgi:hypothetical protein